MGMNVEFRARSCEYQQIEPVIGGSYCCKDLAMNAEGTDTDWDGVYRLAMNSAPSKRYGHNSRT
jgi:hypothetical protein